MNRRSFLLKSGSTLTSISLLSKLKANSTLPETGVKPIVISTWDHGLAANEIAWKILSSGGHALDAVEKGVNVTELDPKVSSVGYGGLPDRDGIITLDASIMDEKGNCGAVSFLQHIKTPISVARLVMEKTPHVMLSGEGAFQFALANGFKKEDLHTETSLQEWLKWKQKNTNKPVDVHNHDTIAMLAIDQAGNLCGACSTSGLAFKLHGRVGDSPIIGAGLFVDNEIGAAGATGLGEVVVKTLGTHSIVENMKHGYSPQEACEEVVKRTLKKVGNAEDAPVYYIAINKKGEIGAYGTKNGVLDYAVYSHEKHNVLIKADGAL